jgi:membrane-associated phospholipid phosphatase
MRSDSTVFTVAACLALWLAPTGDVAAQQQPVPAERAGAGTAHAVPAPIAPVKDDHRLIWRKAWPRFRVIEYGITAALLLELALLEFRAKIRDSPNWTGGVLFDDAIRDGVRLESREGRETAGDIADPITLGLQIYPLVESIVLPLATDRFNVDVATQLTLMNVEVLGAGGFANRFGHKVIGRERPSVAECKKDKSYDKFCKGSRYAGFPSGHTSGAFMGVGMTCAHHMHLPLYGGGAPDVTACAVTAVLGTADGVLRLMGDRHYATDIVAGAAIGFFAGFGIPTLLHYRFGYGVPDSADRGRRGASAKRGSGDPALAAPGFTLVPSATDDDVSLALRGLF